MSTAKAWGRSPENPVKGWYGLKKGLRGRFGMYLPPLLEALGASAVDFGSTGDVPPLFAQAAGRVDSKGPARAGSRAR